MGLLKLKTLFSMLCLRGLLNQWGWPFALGFVLSIYIHEMGHVAALKALRHRGLGAPFIPFIGAIIRVKQSMPNGFRTHGWGWPGPSGAWARGVRLRPLRLYPTGNSPGHFPHRRLDQPFQPDSLLAVGWRPGLPFAGPDPAVLAAGAIGLAFITPRNIYCSPSWVSPSTSPCARKSRKEPDWTGLAPIRLSHRHSFGHVHDPGRGNTAILKPFTRKRQNEGVAQRGSRRTRPRLNRLN